MGTLKSHSIDTTPNSTKERSNFAEESEINLPNDVVYDIIERLPIKALARSKCVSKDWCSHISGHILRGKLPLVLSMLCAPASMDVCAACSNKPLFMCAPDNHQLEKCPLDFFPSNGTTVICDGSNGLLLCQTHGTPDFFIASPLTRRWVALPSPQRYGLLSVLAYDPFSSTCYHVINFTSWRYHGATIEVYSSKTREWTESYVDFHVPTFSLSGLMHYNNGFLYITSYVYQCVVCINITDFTCTLIKLPNPMNGPGQGRVSHSNGQLHFVCSDKKHLNIWVLEELHNMCRWQFKHALKINDLMEGGYKPGVELKFLALDPKDDAVYLLSPLKIVRYNFTKREITSKTWKFAKDATVHIIKTWVVPSSSYLPDSLPDGLRHKVA